jgi:hypothetical protein
MQFETKACHETLEQQLWVDPKEEGQGARICKYGFSLLHMSSDYIAVHVLHGVSGTLLYEILQCDKFVLPQVAQKEICMHGMCLGHLRFTSRVQIA